MGLAAIRNPKLVASATVAESQLSTLLAMVPPTAWAKLDEDDVELGEIYPMSSWRYTNGTLYLLDTIPQADLDLLVASLVAPTVAVASRAVVASKEEALANINRAFSEAFATALAGYPPEEVQTWIYQADEAKDVVRQKGNPTPILSAIVTQTGENIDTLATSILAKEAAYKLVIGDLVGKRHRLVTQLAGLDLVLPSAAVDIAAITWAAP